MDNCVVIHGNRARNKVLILYTVNCCSYIAERITKYYKAIGADVDLVGNESCFDNQAIINRLLRYVSHRNVGAVLVVSHGCEFTQGEKIKNFAMERGRLADIVYSQHEGTETTIDHGITIVGEMIQNLKRNEKYLVDYGERTIGLSVDSRCLNDTTSKIIACFCGECIKHGFAIVYNPVFFDDNLKNGLAESLGDDAKQYITKSSWLYEKSYCLPCNQSLGILNEKLLPMSRGFLKISQKPKSSGIWFLDPYQDFDLYKGYANASISSDMMEFAACNAECVFFFSDTTSSVSIPLLPVVRCSFEDAQTGGYDFVFPKDVEKTPHIIYGKLLDILNGETVSSEKDSFNERMIFQNMQEL